jgi:DNA-directed RNA polymerase specialized sigma24 family protein
VPDDVPDYEEEFFARCGFSFTEGVEFLREQAGLMVCADDAADLVQDFVAEKLLPWLLGDPGDPLGNPKGFLHTRLCWFHIDFRRRESRRPRPTDRLLDGACGAGEATSAAMRASFWSVVDGAGFPRECAEVIRLRLDRETFAVLRTWQEIGARLRITRDTARLRYSRGIELIRPMFDDDGEQEET